jgi:hypothetical protein
LADGSDPVLATLRFVAFAAVAILGPGVTLQRLVRVRWDPVLVVPLGLAFCSFGYWLGLVTGAPWILPSLALLVDAPLLRPSLVGRPAQGPPARGALPAVLLLILLLGITQYPLNRTGSNGEFLLDRGEHTDTAVHVGLVWELVAGYPPELPGFSGVELHYHLGSHLVRAAATRWAGTHPYDSFNRFDVTLWGIALILALRGAAHALGLGTRATTLVGFLPLASGLSFVPGLASGVAFWAFKASDGLVEAVFFANSIVPAMAMALGAVTALARAERSEGRGWLVLAAALGVGAVFFKVFTGALLLLALGTAWALRRDLRLVLVALPPAAALALLVAGSLGPSDLEGVRVSFVPFAPVNPARTAFGLETARGVSLLISGLVWVALSLGVRVLGIPAALRAARGPRVAPSVLGAFALWGWPLTTLVSIKADPAVDESFYFMQASGLALWLFASPVLVRMARRSLIPAGLALLASLAGTGEFLLRAQQSVPMVVPAPAVRAMAALREASHPGDVVLMQVRIPHVPLPVVLAGRRVAFADFIGYWRQFVTPETRSRRRELVRSFFQARDAETARVVARQLEARYVYLSGPRRSKKALERTGVIELLFQEGSERVYKINLAEPRPGDEDPTRDRGPP